MGMRKKCLMTGSGRTCWRYAEQPRRGFQGAKITGDTQQTGRLLDACSARGASADAARVKVRLQDSHRCVGNLLDDRHMPDILVHATPDLDDGDVAALWSVCIDDGKFALPRTKAIWQGAHAVANEKDAVVGVRCTVQYGRGDAPPRRYRPWDAGRCRPVGLPIACAASARNSLFNGATSGNPLG